MHRFRGTDSLLEDRSLASIMCRMRMDHYLQGDTSRPFARIPDQAGENGDESRAPTADGFESELSPVHPDDFGGHCQPQTLPVRLRRKARKKDLLTDFRGDAGTLVVDNHLPSVFRAADGGASILTRWPVVEAWIAFVTIATRPCSNWAGSSRTDGRSG